jgi:hypothetical protein
LCIIPPSRKFCGFRNLVDRHLGIIHDVDFIKTWHFYAVTIMPSLPLCNELE